jgi:hypothetical protein
VSKALKRRGLAMKKIGVLFALLLVVGCNEEAKRQPPPVVAPVAPAAPAAPSPEALAAAQAEALKNALTVDPVEGIAKDGRVVIRAHLKNPTAGEIRPVLSWDGQGTWWQGEKATMSPVPPGGEGTIEVQAKIGDRVYPLPRARIELAEGRQKLCGWDFLDRAMAAVAPLVREWNIAGPFDLGMPGKAADDNDEKALYLKGPLAGWENPLPPEKGVDPAATYAGKDGKSVRWQTVKADRTGLVTLGSVGQTPWAVACAVVYIYSPEARSYRFSAGSNDSLRVRINGKEVWKKHAVRGATADQDAFSADLKEGWNEVLLKLAHRAGEWGFYFRVIDPQRQLKFALKPESSPRNQ